MTRARSFGVFILALCLVACVCAHGEEAVTKETAKAAAVAVQESAKKLLTKATEEKGKADELLKNINTYKKDADAAKEEAVKLPKTNKDAQSIVQKANEASESLLQMHTKFSKGTGNLVDKMKDFFTRATGLEQEAKKLFDGVETASDHTKTKTSAEELKTKVESLDSEIDAAKKDVVPVQTAATNAEKTVDEIKKALKPATPPATPPATTPATSAPGQSEDTVAQKTEEPKNPDVTQGIDKVIPQVTTGGPAGSGVTEPTKPSSGDSAMTVSVPLLMALIACAALQ